MPSKLSVVIPCFNSSENFPELIDGIKLLNRNLPSDVLAEYVLVDDGSADDTWECMQKFKNEIPHTTLLKLTGNFGSYPAFLAGLNYASGDCFVQLHADLQDPPDHVPEMLGFWKNGWKLVIGQRVQREEGFWHQAFALTYHKLIKKYALPHIPDGGYDLILFDKELRDKIVEMNETNINLVYLISWLKHPYVTIPITRVKREKGKSGWTFSRKVKLVVDSFVGFSYFPIRVLSAIAILLVLLFTGIGAMVLFKLISGSSVSNTLLLIWGMSFFASILGFMLAVVAEYLWRTLEAARKRPPFVVDKLVQ